MSKSGRAVEKEWEQDNNKYILVGIIFTAIKTNEKVMDNKNKKWKRKTIIIIWGQLSQTSKQTQEAG